MFKRLIIAPVIVAAFLIPSVVSAETVEYSCNVSRSRLDWRVDTQTETSTVKKCDLNQFDADLGDLLSVNITMVVQTDTVQRVENRDETPHTLTSRVNVDTAMFDTDATTRLLDATITAADASFDATAFDGNEDYDGDSGNTFDVEYAENTLQSTLMDNDIISPFIGTGVMSYPVEAIANWTCSGSGNASCAVDTYAAAQITVSYEYEPLRPDLVINNCTDVSITDGQVGSYEIQGANQGEADITSEVSLVHEIPVCMSLVDQDYGLWDCNELDGSLNCSYGGSLPSGAYLPVLPVSVQANGCVGTAFKAPVRLEVDGETAVENNSYACGIGYIEPSEPLPTPEVLGETDEPEEPTTCDTVVSGHVFHDENENGIQDADEEDLPNITVYITLSDGTSTAVETDSNGDYELCAIPGEVSSMIDVNDSDLPSNPKVTTNNENQNRDAIDGKVNAMDDVGISSDDGSVLATTGYFVAIATFVGAAALFALFFVRRRKNKSLVQNK